MCLPAIHVCPGDSFKMTCFDSGFQRCQFALLGSLGSRHTLKQDVLVAGAWDIEQFNSQGAGSRAETGGARVGCALL